MNKLDKRLTVTINAYGEEVKITAPAWLLNDISLAYTYWAEYCKSKCMFDATKEVVEDRSYQIYQQLRDKGLYE